MASLTITASILYDLASCPTRVYMDAFSDQSKRDQVSPFVQLLWEKGNAYEQQVIGGLRLPVLDLSRLQSVDKETQTLAAMSRGESLIYGGRISIDDLLGEPDLLRKEADGYVPGDIKAGGGEEGSGEDIEGRPKIHYAVQLALYVDVLNRLKFSTGRRAFIWDVHGKEVSYDFATPQGPKNPATLWDEYEHALSEARSILSRKFQPAAAYSSTCKMCWWHSSCIESLSKSDDLTLIPMLGRSKRQAMQPTIATIAELAKINPERFISGKKTIFAGIGPETLRTFHKRAQLLKSKNPKPYLKHAVQLPSMTKELFFDIEFDPMRDVCYLHGFVERIDRDNNTERFVSFFSDDADSNAESEAFAKAWSFLKAARPAAVFYYSKYERTIYRKLQQKYPNICSADDIEYFFDSALSPTVDLYFDVVFRSTEWPTRDYSIKTLAKYLGFQWRDSNPSGAASIEWFNQWTLAREPATKQRILDYNEDDCRATRVLLDGIRSL